MRGESSNTCTSAVRQRTCVGSPMACMLCVFCAYLELLSGGIAVYRYSLDLCFQQWSCGRESEDSAAEDMYDVSISISISISISVVLV